MRRIVACTALVVMLFTVGAAATATGGGVSCADDCSNVCGDCLACTQPACAAVVPAVAPATLPSPARGAAAASAVTAPPRPIEHVPLSVPAS